MTKFIFQLLILLSILTITDTSYSQQSLDSIINFTLTYRGLTQQDITIPVNFDKDKSPTNDAKLILPVVRDLMKEPMKSFEFTDDIESIKDLNLIQILERLYKLKNVDSQFLSKILINENGTPGQFYDQILSFVKERNNFKKKLVEGLNKEDRDFLNQYLFSIIAETEEDDGVNSDIFKFNKARDSSIAVSKRTMEILSRIKLKDELNYGIHDAEFCWLVYNMLKGSKIDFSETEYESNKFINGNYYFYYDRDGFRIAIGGKGKNIYTGHFDFIIDTGGDDVYNIDRETNDLFNNNFSCIIDLSGNDYYTSGSNYSLAGSVFSSGFIFDKEGDDTYKGKNVSLGSAICGLGVLYDENGNDTYQANQFSIGASSFGVGLLLDRNGNDVYLANSYSQGFGMTEGTGAIVDNKGNDNYLIDARSLDIGRYEDHYISMSQGYGLGLRPYYAGGIGLIIEGEGNDFYSTDIFGQGGAYWYALGCIVDKSGHDKYNSYQYAQGAGIHLAVGLLKDSDGWDMFSSNGVSQGCGHDFGFGLLYDVKGNDNYSAYSLSQGAGNANGIGMLIDESGRDGYLNKEPGNSRGYGNSRREYGSLGIFLDASGEDFYSAGGMDSVINNNSMWGVMTDYYLQDLRSQASGNAYKVPLDSNKNYTAEEYFILAKTIEPRFSLWQEYGFRKLAEDSLNTPEYILKYLDTDDHRAGGNNELVYALSGRTGGLLWTYGDSSQTADGDVNGLSVLKDYNGDGKKDVLVAASGEGEFNGRHSMICLNALNGSVIFYSSQNAEFTHSTTSSSSGAIIDFSHNGGPYGINGYNNTGGFMWTFPTASTVWNLKEIQDVNADANTDIASFIGFNGTISILSGSNGSLVWSQNFGQSIDGNIRLMDDISGDGYKDIVSSGPRSLYRIDSKTSNIFWSSPLDNNYIHGVDQLSDLTGNGVKEIVAGTQNSNLYIVNGDSGRILFTYNFGTATTNTVEQVAGLKSIDGNVSSEFLGGSRTGKLICFSGGPNGVVGITNSSSEIPDKFTLSQNYPNPFNPVTKISFSIPSTEYSILKVYDALGKELQVLVNERLNAGNYEAEFNGNNFASGVYFYKLESGEFVETKRMILLK